MMAQSALRCSCADLSIGARGSAAGFGVRETLAGLVSLFFEEPWPWVVVEVVVGGFGASRREGVVVSTRALEPTVVCDGHGLRHCSWGRGPRRAGCPARGSKTDRIIMLALAFVLVVLVMLSRSTRLPSSVRFGPRAQLQSFHAQGLAGRSDDSWAGRGVVSRLCCLGVRDFASNDNRSQDLGWRWQNGNGRKQCRNELESSPQPRGTGSSALWGRERAWALQGGWGQRGARYTQYMTGGTVL